MENHEFEKLLEILSVLLGPTGCPWDREQTFMSLREAFLEESCELIEAIDLNNPQKIIEEVGDLFQNVLFLCKIAEKEQLFSLSQVLNELSNKLVRRHPHVFGSARIETIDQLLKQWDQIKKSEKSNDERKSAIDGIPKGMPALARATKVISKIVKTSYPLRERTQNLHFENEEELGETLLSIVFKAKEKGLHPEQALRFALAHMEDSFRSWERETV